MSNVQLVKKPKLIVFDLDYTLWPFWVDTHVDPPFHGSKGNVFDSRGQKVKYYSEVPSVLKKLKTDNYILGIASRTSEIRGANQLLEVFGWNQYFTYKEIFPGCKVQHFENMKKKSGIQFEDMLFFDDEDRNIKDLKKAGVTSILVRDGVNMRVIEEGLRKYIEEH